MFNNCYLVAPNNGFYEGVGLSEYGPFNVTGGDSMIVDYRGKVMSKATVGSDTFASGVIDIETSHETLQ